MATKSTSPSLAIVLDDPVRHARWRVDLLQLEGRLDHETRARVVYFGTDAENVLVLPERRVRNTGMRTWFWKDSVEFGAVVNDPSLLDVQEFVNETPSYGVFLEVTTYDKNDQVIDRRYLPAPERYAGANLFDAPLMAYTFFEEGIDAVVSSLAGIGTWFWSGKALIDEYLLADGDSLVLDSGQAPPSGDGTGGSEDPPPDPPPEEEPGTVTLLGTGSVVDTLTAYPRTGEVTEGDWYVDPTATSNGIGGVVESPFNNLHSAIAAAQPYQTILVRNGELTPGTQYRVTVPGLRVFNYGAERFTINAGALLTNAANPVPIYIEGDDQHWKGFDVYGVKPSTSYNYDIGGIRAHMVDSPVLEDITYRDSQAGGFYFYGVNNGVIMDCEYRDVDSVGAGLSPTNMPDGVVTTGGGNNNAIVRNLIAYAPDDGIDMFTGSGHVVLNNVVFRSGYRPGTLTSTGGDGYGIKAGGGDPTVGNNLVEGNLTIENRESNVNANSAPEPNTYLRNTAYSCTGYGFNFFTNGGTVGHDNISVLASPNFDDSGVEGTYNSWNDPADAGGNPNFPLSAADCAFADVANHDYSLGASSLALTAGESGGPLGASEEALLLAKKRLPLIAA